MSKLLASAATKGDQKRAEPNAHTALHYAASDDMTDEGVAATFTGTGPATYLDSPRQCSSYLSLSTPIPHIPTHTLSTGSKKKSVLAWLTWGQRYLTMLPRSAGSSAVVPGPTGTLTILLETAYILGFLGQPPANNTMFSGCLSAPARSDYQGPPSAHPHHSTQGRKIPIPSNLMPAVDNNKTASSPL